MAHQRGCEEALVDDAPDPEHYIDGQRAAVVVHRHGAHIINVFAWNPRDGSLPNIVTRQDYHIVFWRNGSLVFLRRVGHGIG